jgi:hypothetical protein
MSPIRDTEVVRVGRRQLETTPRSNNSSRRSSANSSDDWTLGTCRSGLAHRGPTRLAASHPNSVRDSKFTCNHPNVAA